MTEDFYESKKRDKLDFKQICLKHYQNILELSCGEFCGGYFNYVFSGNITNKSYVTDKRAEFSQAVESLALALYPHFDKEMNKDYEKFLEDNKTLTSKYSDIDGFIIEDNKKIKYSVEKINLIKELFKKLSCLMFRLNYFKAASYSESDIAEAGDSIVDVDGGEVNKTPEEREEND